LSHNGHKNGVNPHDLIAARIVAGALSAEKMPPAAAKAVFGAMGAAGVKPPEPDRAIVHEDGQPARCATDAEMDTGCAATAAKADSEAAARRIELHQEALVLAMVRERMELDSIEMRDLEPGELQGFDYLPVGDLPGYREYELAGQPLVRFYSPEVAFDNGAMLVNLRYRVAL